MVLKFNKDSISDDKDCIKNRTSGSKIKSRIKSDKYEKSNKSQKLEKSGKSSRNDIKKEMTHQEEEERENIKNSNTKNESAK